MIAARLMPPPLLLNPRRRKAPAPPRQLQLQLDELELVVAESPLARRAAAAARSRRWSAVEEFRIVNFSERV